MENYIVRIYDRNTRNPLQVTGILESVESETRQAFHTLDSLRDLLLQQPGQREADSRPSGDETKLPPETIALTD